MRKTEEREIDGESYEFHQLGAIKAHSLLLKVGKIIGPTFGEMADSSKGGIEGLLDADIDLGSVIQGLFERADDKIVLGVITTLLSQAIHHGVGCLQNEAIVDEHFAGRLPHMYKVILASAEVQYGDFFAEGGMLSNLKSKVPVGNQKK
ncbi:hypothetical protein KAR91_15465 [Candidatus Pacearchaeota archaeon]|nr:hypothetical protein [Candidatus Pacearchaeota archaeon]